MRSLCVFSSFFVRETPSYLTHPGHSYFYADNGGPLVFVSPNTPFTASVSKHIYSCMHHRRRRRCGAVKCGDRLHIYWSVPLFVSSLGFFHPHGACLDLDRRCNAIGRQKSRAPPPPASRGRHWFPDLCFYNMLSEGKLQVNTLSFFFNVWNKQEIILTSGNKKFPNMFDKLFVFL